MTYKFSQTSRNLLNQCHRDIIICCNELIKIVDFSVLSSTIRTKQEQEEFFKQGKTKTLNSKHLLKPSQAIDLAPYPIDWNDTLRFYYFAGLFLGTANYMKVMGLIQSTFRWGGDWNKNNTFSDDKFKDLVHFEIY